VEWDWLMLYERFQRTVETMLPRVYLFGLKSRQLLKEILEADKAFDVPHDGQEHPFDHTILPWNELRSHAFQSLPMDSYRVTWLAGTKPDGLAVIAEFVLLAVAKGSVRVNASGKGTIQVDAVGLFIHDGFDFEEDQWLGNWSCEGKEFSILSGVSLDNVHFRRFRMRTGYGCDFRIMNEPELYSVARYRYNAHL